MVTSTAPRPLCELPIGPSPLRIPEEKHQLHSISVASAVSFSASVISVGRRDGGDICNGAGVEGRWDTDRRYGAE